MKNILLAAVTAVALAACSGTGASNAHAEFYVRGNCEMCKERIDHTVKNIPGVSNADWNLDTETMTVDFDSTKVSAIDIEKTVAATGHATKDIPMDKTAHDNLPACCKEKGM